MWRHASAPRLAGRFVTLLLIIVMVALAHVPHAFATPIAASWQPGTAQCTIANKDVTELSGLAASRNTPGGFFVHNDSGDQPATYLVRPDCVTALTVVVQDTVAFDWEDAAPTYLLGGTPTLLFGDIGDNLLIRDQLRVVEVIEPGDASSRADDEQSVRPYATYRVRYPTGRHDAEALFATPDRRLGIITKEADGIALVYLSVAALDPAQPAVDLVQVATIDLNAVWLSGQQLGARQLRVTAADLSPDGTQLAVRTTAGAWVWTVPGDNLDAASNGLWAEALRQPPVQTLSFPEMTQAEAIAFDASGRDIVSASEGNKPVLYKASGSRDHARAVSSNTPTTLAPSTTSTPDTTVISGDESPLQIGQPDTSSVVNRRVTVEAAILGTTLIVTIATGALILKRRRNN